MFLTKEELQKRQAPRELLDLFNKEYSQEIEFLSFLDENTSFLQEHWRLLWWMQYFLSLNEKEKEQVFTLLKIVESEAVAGSFNVSYSSSISNSNCVKNSSDIYYSNDVINSDDIYNSYLVENSRHIKNSEFVEKSEQVYDSKNVTEGNIITNSTFVVKSKMVLFSYGIESSKFVDFSSNIENSYFVSNCENLKSCLFCYDQKEGEYLIFNKPVTEQKFKVAAMQAENFISRFIMPKDTNYLLCYNSFQDKFWDWVKTLPNYDPEKLQSITSIFFN